MADGTLDADHPVPCKIAANGNAGELSLAENVIRIAMHPADQVVAFSQLARSGVTVAAIAARFGVAERLVEQRLRLGNAAPELLDAYRADDIDLETLKAFSITTDHDRQRTIWERVAGQGYRPSAWQVKRMLTEERVPAGSSHALDIAFNETADRPTTRTNDDEFAAWSPGEAMLGDWSHLPFEWMEGDNDAACFTALRELPRADKEKLFAAAVARTVKGQLAFEHGARPELEATVARLDIDFAKHVRPTADMLWSRIPSRLPPASPPHRPAPPTRPGSAPSPRRSGPRSTG